MARILLRFLQVIVLTAFVGQMTGFVPPIESHDCEENCPDEEGSDDGCSQSCHLCPCCPSLRLTASVLSLAVWPLSVLGRIDWNLRERPSSPEPGEIFHVPKQRLA